MRTADQRPFRVVITNDELIVLFRGEEDLGPYDESTLDLAENMERQRSNRPTTLTGVLKSFFARLTPASDRLS